MQSAHNGLFVVRILINIEYDVTDFYWINNVPGYRITYKVQQIV